MKNLTVITMALCAILTIACSRSGASTDEESSQSAQELESRTPVLELDTVMYANGHAFAYGNIDYLQGEWYFDTICVGFDDGLEVDSVGPQSLKLKLGKNSLKVNFGDAEAAEKIRKFLNPHDGFAPFSKNYAQVLASFEDDEYGTIESIGNYSFYVLFADSSIENSGMINSFIRKLAGAPNDEAAPESIANFLARKTFDEWISDGDACCGWDNGACLAIKPHTVCPQYITFFKYDYNRIGIGHGGYAATFHTLDLESGKELGNSDIFDPNALDMVEMELFEVMAHDPHYLDWHSQVKTADDVKAMLYSSGVSDEDGFMLPDGALTDDGVVFSFQPYELTAGAAGEFHFIVPYDKLWPCLAKKWKIEN